MRDRPVLVAASVRHGTVTSSPPCTRRHSKHTIWFWQEDGGPPVPMEVSLDNHADMVRWVGKYLGADEAPPASLRWVKAFRTHNESYECFHWENDAQWPPPHYHCALVTYTRRWRDWFRKRYLVRCTGVDCDLHDGPYPTKARAEVARVALDGT